MGGRCEERAWKGEEIVCVGDFVEQCRVSISWRQIRDTAWVGAVFEWSILK